MEFVFDKVKLKKSIWIKRYVQDEIGVSDMCNMIGISRSTFNRFEHGKDIDMNTFLKMCSYVEIPPSAFFISKM